MSDSFAHLHAHTEYSMLDGAAKVAALLAKAVALSQPAVASTDHGNVFSHYEMWKTAAAMRAAGADIKFVAGCELYVAPAGRFHKAPVFWGSAGNSGKKGDAESKDVSGAGAFTHMTMLALNGPGLHALFELTSRASIEGAYAKVGAAKPRVDAELVAEVLGNWPGAQLVGTTGCPSGAVQTRLRLGQLDKAAEEAAIWRDILGPENYFLELMDHGNEIEKVTRDGLMELARTMNLPLLATNDSHYVEPDDATMHDALLALQMGNKLSDTDRMRFDGSGYHLRSSADMRGLFAELPAACDNTLAISERVAPDAYDQVLGYRDDLLPEFPVPDGHTEASYLRERVYAGLQEKYPDPAAADGVTPEARERAEYELGTIEKMGYPGYMLMVWDFVGWAREQGIRVGPGRGSAAGSLVSYALDITTVPTLEHGLLFERFINPERVSPPDVDVDFEKLRRDEVFRYLAQKWGAGNVCRIQTLNTIKAKAALKDANRVLGNAYGLGEKLTKLFPKAVSGFEAPLACVDDPQHDRYADAADFRAALDKEDGAREVFDLAQQLEGLVRSTGVHACGFVVSHRPLMGRVPLVWSEKDQQVVSGFPNADVLEPMGYLKVDCLGLDTMDVTHRAIDLIRERHGVDVEDKLAALDDPAAYALLASGSTVGMFQVASSGLSRLLAQMKADRFADISAALALYRPGPMGAEAHTAYALRKTGRQQIKPIHPELEEPLKDVLGPTYGLCVTGDTLIWDAGTGKLVRIDSVSSRVQDGSLRTFGIDSTGSPVARRVTHWIPTGRKPVLEITSSTGQVLRVSAEHPVLTPDGWKPAGDLRAGVDRLARPTGEMEPLGPSRLEVAQARFLGYLTGDGYCTLRANAFYNTEPALIAEVVALAADLFPDVHPSYPQREEGSSGVPRVDFMAHPQGIGRGRGARKGVSGGSVYDDLSLNVWLRSLGFVTPPRSPDWWVPRELLGSSNEVIRHYLAALWDCDGHVAEGMTFFRTISQKLASGVEQLLSRLGILANVSISETYESRRGEQEAYSVHVYDPKFWDEIVPLMAHPGKNTIRRQQAVRSQLTRGINGTLMLSKLHQHVLKDGTMPPHVRSRVERAGALSERSARSYLNRQHGATLALTSNAARRGRGGYVPHGELAETYLAHYGEDLDFFYANQHWVSVESIIESGPEEMYDITVEGVHNFLANGFVVHNCVYQEEIMLAVQKVAGYSLGKADLLRKAMGKKKPEVLAKEFVPFRAGMHANGFSDEAIQALWDVFLPFSAYAFNVAHTVSYGHITYATAYLKAHYPAEFMAALLTLAGDDKKKLALYLGEARRMGLKVLVPDVNAAGATFAPTDDGVRFGLEAVKGLGPKAVAGIIAGRADGPYRNFADFLERIPESTCTKTALRALIKGGAFDSLGYTRNALDACYEHGVGAHMAAKKKAATGQHDLFSTCAEIEFEAVTVPDLPEWDEEEKLALERGALGTWVSGHPLTRLARVLAGNRTISLAQLATDEPTEGMYQLSGQLVEVQHKVAKSSGNGFAIAVLEDLTGRVELRCTGRNYIDCRHLLVVDQRVSMKVNLKYDEEKDKTDTMILTIDGLDETKEADEPQLVDGETPVVLRISRQECYIDLMAELQRILRRHPGERPAQVLLERDDAGWTRYRLPGVSVQPGVEFQTEVKELLGRNGLSL